MFVGDVRCAITGRGVSWKLSGGSAWLSTLTNVAKNRQVRRAINRSACASTTESGSAGAVFLGMLIQRATTGDATHSARNGSATGSASGRAIATTTATSADSDTLPAIRRQKPRRSRRRPAFACAAVTHSNRRRCVTYTRTSVRTIASPITHAWCASIVIVRPICDAASTMSRPTARAWLRFEIPRPRGITPPSTNNDAGTAIVATTNALHTAGDPPGTSQATSSVSTAARAESVRRRLSSIFQRPITGTRRPRIHGRSCQSPRPQRCWRAVATP